MSGRSRLRLLEPDAWPEAMRGAADGPMGALNVMKALMHHPDLFRRWSVFANHFLFKGALPASAPARRSMRVWLAFWGRAIGDAGVARLQRRTHEHWRARVRDALEAARSCGALPAEMDADEEAEPLVAHIRGICIRALVDPSGYGPDAQLNALGRYLGRLGHQTEIDTRRTGGERRRPRNARSPS